MTRPPGLRKVWFGWSSQPMEDFSNMMLIGQRHMVEAHPEIGELSRYPALAKHCAVF